MTNKKQGLDFYHYTDCGLDYVYLANGFRRVKDRALGEMVAIRDLDGLHRTIAETIINHAPCVRGQEIRFFRSYLKLNQTQMGILFKKDMRTIQRWEEDKRNEPIPPVADNFIRLFILAHLSDHHAAKRVCEMLKDVREEVVNTPKKACEPSKFFNQLAMSDTSRGWKAAA